MFELEKSELKKELKPVEVQMFENNPSEKRMDIKSFVDSIHGEVVPEHLDQEIEMQECPHCHRRFNKKAAERHIPRCQNIQHKPKPPPSKEQNTNREKPDQTSTTQHKVTADKGSPKNRTIPSIKVSSADRASNTRNALTKDQASKTVEENPKSMYKQMQKQIFGGIQQKPTENDQDLNSKLLKISANKTFGTRSSSIPVSVQRLMLV